MQPTHNSGIAHGNVDYYPMVYCNCMVSIVKNFGYGWACVPLGSR